MIAREDLSQPTVRLAIAALVLSTMLAGATLYRAVKPTPPELVRVVPFDASAALIAPPARPPADLGIAVDNDLFAADRSEPDTPYRIPGEEEIVAAEPKAEPVIPTVLGTAVMGEGRGFATCQLGDAPPVIVHVGDRIGEYTVKSIERGRVVFTTASKRLDIPALKTGA